MEPLLILPTNIRPHHLAQRPTVGQPPKLFDGCDEIVEARARADDALNYERIPPACKIPGSIRSNRDKAQVAGTSSLPRCPYASGPELSHSTVTPGEEFAPAQRLAPVTATDARASSKREHWKQRRETA
jgi:hypothetical protein